MPNACCSYCTHNRTCKTYSFKLLILPIYNSRSGGNLRVFTMFILINYRVVYATIFATYYNIVYITNMFIILLLYLNPRVHTMRVTIFSHAGFSYHIPNNRSHRRRCYTGVGKLNTNSSNTNCRNSYYHYVYQSYIILKTKTS